MIDSIVESTMRKAILRFAKDSNSECSEHQILIAFNAETGTPKYKHLMIGGISKEIPFLEILGLKFDLLNREMIVAQFISKTFVRYSKEYECLPQNIFVLLSLPNEDEDIILSLYKGNTFIKEIDLEQLIGM
jgi:hypothetical protein